MEERKKGRRNKEARRKDIKERNNWREDISQGEGRIGGGRRETKEEGRKTGEKSA